MFSLFITEGTQHNIALTYD